MIDLTHWREAQKSESEFWGQCLNTYGEETKQFIYLDRMGFKRYHDGRGPFAFDAQGKSFIDIGGGPSSALLKFNNLGASVVMDPCPYPEWVYHRYQAAGITVLRTPAEDLNWPLEGSKVGLFDVALIYNCLQHTIDPEKIVRNAIKYSRELHVFEWINIPAHEGHPHELTQDALERWTGRKGTVEALYGQNECYGEAWFI